ncbi:hemolysin XhlA family protein [Bacillus sp. SIMBA_074]|uniref:hemolysin XhlA family protein n=1 Tax=Bacillus sp. SIMBA_074 TaxID=3085812 RepID=UPI00397D704B
MENTVNYELQELKNDIHEIKLEQKEMKGDIRNLDIRTTSHDREIININKTLDKISANTTWILRIIIGAIVTALIGLLLKGGV